MGSAPSSFIEAKTTQHGTVESETISSQFLATREHREALASLAKDEPPTTRARGESTLRSTSTRSISTPIVPRQATHNPNPTSSQPRSKLQAASKPNPNTTYKQQTQVQTKQDIEAALVKAGYVIHASCVDGILGNSIDIDGGWPTSMTIEEDCFVVSLQLLSKNRV